MKLARRRTNLITRLSSRQQYGFWSGNTTLRNQDILQISMFGDSITAGSFNEPKASRVWTPEATADLIAKSARTVTTGSNLWPASGYALSSGASYSNGVFTLTASAGDTNPRFADSATVTGVAAISGGKLHRIQAEINTDGCVGKHLALRRFGWKGTSTTVIVDRNFGGDDEATDGYVEVSGVVSSDYMLALASDVDKLKVGGEIVGETSGVGLIRNVEVHELSRGVAVINQGVSGDDTIEGLARIATVTAWTPDVVVIAFGTNDIREHNNLTTFTNNLTTMCSTIEAAGGYPVLATIPPLASDQANYDDVPAWNEAILALAQSLAVGFWDRWAALDNGDIVYIDDGRHPTRAGYLKLAANAAYQIAGVTA